MPTNPDRQLSTAEVRRAQVIAAAIPLFAQRGYYGTSTNDVAGAAKLSQAYVYRLFPHKEALFVAVVETVTTRLHDAIKAVADEVRTTSPQAGVRDILPEVARRLHEDRDLIAILMHGNCAAVEPGIRDAVRDCYRAQVDFLRDDLGAPDADIPWFIASGLLSNVMFALEASDVDEPWAAALFGALR